MVINDYHAENAKFFNKFGTFFLLLFLVGQIFAKAFSALIKQSFQSGPKYEILQNQKLRICIFWTK